MYVKPGKKFSIQNIWLYAPKYTRRVAQTSKYGHNNGINLLNRLYVPSLKLKVRNLSREARTESPRAARRPLSGLRPCFASL